MPDVVFPSSHGEVLIFFSTNVSHHNHCVLSDHPHPQTPSQDSFYRIALKKLGSERDVLAPSDPEPGGFSPETGWKATFWDVLETLGGSACLPGDNRSYSDSSSLEN